MWQAKDLRERVFGIVAMIGLTGEFSEVWQGKELGDEGDPFRQGRNVPSTPNGRSPAGPGQGGLASCSDARLREAGKEGQGRPPGVFM